MKRAWRTHFLTPLLILTMLISILPMNISYAASITLENSLESYTESNPLQVFSPTMTISGYINGAAASDVKCEVIQVSSGTGGTVGLSPQVSGSSFTFNGVGLYPGLNKVRVYLSGTEKRFWVYYLDSPSISNIQILAPDGQYKPLNNYVAVDPFSTTTFDTSNFKNTFDKVMETFPGSVNIAGDTRNVKRVFVNGSEITSPPSSNRFFHNAAINGIYKGNHTLVISGENESGGAFSLPFQMAVENSEPTFFNLAVRNEENGTVTSEFLDSSKEVSVNLPNQTFNFGGDLYFSAKNSVLPFDNSLFEEKINKIRISVKDKNGNVVGNIEKTQSQIASYPNIIVNDSFGAEKYRVYRLTNLTLPGIPTGEYQVEFTAYYNGVSPTAYTTQKFAVTYINPSIGFIKNVIVKSNNLSLESSPFLMSASEKLAVEVNDATTSVELTSELNGQTYSPGSNEANPPQSQTAFSVTGPSGNKKAEIPLAFLRPGLQSLKFKPISNPTNGDVKEIRVNVVLTPSLRILGMVNNQTYTTSKPSELTVQYVNLNSQSDRAKTKINLNGVEVTETYPNRILHATDNSNTGIARLQDDSFRISRDLFTELINGTEILRLGENTLTFTTYSGTSNTSIIFKFYYLPETTPSLGALTPESATQDPTPDPSPFRKDPNRPGTYYTTEKIVRLKGIVQNEMAKVILLKKNGKEIARLYQDGTNPNDRWNEYDREDFFTARNIDPQNTGNTTGVTFETILDPFATDQNSNTEPGTSGKFSIGNEMSLLYKDPVGKTIWNGTTVYTVEAYGKYDYSTNTVDYPVASATITITREVAPYEFTGRARMIMEEQNGVTDDNFFPFDIYTEAADQVTVNKLTAKKVEDNNLDGKLRYAVDVPLKPGVNKLKLEIKRGDQTVNDEVEVTYANVPIQGSLFRVTLGKSTKFKVFDKKVELEFDKGTMLKTDDARDNFNTLLNETPVLFGIADSEMGIVSKDELKSSRKNILKNVMTIPSNYMLTDNVYWIDAGTSKYPGGLTPLEDADNNPDNSDDSTIIYRSSNQEENLLPTKDGTLKIQYNPSIRMDLARRVTMMYHDGVRWQNIGGKVDAKNNIIEVPFRKFGYYAVMREKEVYQDIAGHPWAKEQLELLSARNWMQPSGDSSINFGAYDTATRGEFATVLVKVFNIPLNYEGESTFLDVPRGLKTDLYEQKYIETAFRVGIISGKAVGVFDPQGTLMRQDAAVMIARAANYKLNEYEKAQKTMVKAFVDQEQINRYAVPSVEAVYKKKVMQGLPIDENPKNKQSRFAPYTPLTRDQVAVITYALLKDQKLVK